MDDNFYYEAPSDKTFKEVKENAYHIWKSYDDQFGYATEKLNRIKDLTNVRDNCMFIIAMFDGMNQTILASRISPEARKEISDRIKAGGSPAEFNMFMDAVDRMIAMMTNPKEEAPFSYAIMEEKKGKHV